MAKPDRNNTCSCDDVDCFICGPRKRGEVRQVSRWWIVNPEAPLGERVLDGPFTLESDATQCWNNWLALESQAGRNARGWVVEVLGDSRRNGRWGASPVGCPQLDEEFSEDLAEEWNS